MRTINQNFEDFILYFLIFFIYRPKCKRFHNNLSLIDRYSCFTRKRFKKQWKNKR
jgi:hypothetical protein